MLQALLAGVSSTRAQQTKLNVIGSNLANVNTTAYKGARVGFEDMLSQTIAGAARPGSAVGGKNPLQIGLGVKVASTAVNTSQGSLNATNRPSDIAIQGEGFFALSNGSLVNYTRDGAFSLDAKGNMVSQATGQQLLGWQADANGVIDTSKPITTSSTLNIPVGASKAAKQTTSIDLAGNLDSRTAGTNSWSTTVKVYDSLGNAQDVDITFNNPRNFTSSTAPTGAPNATRGWDWTAKVGATTVGSSATTGNGPIYFDAQGKTTGTLVNGSLSLPGPGSTTYPISLKMDKVNGLATESSVNITDQDGFPAGSLVSYSIGADGIITGQFSNGLNRGLGQIALTSFANPEGLQRQGDNTWQVTDNSGSASFGTPVSSGRGSLNAGFLEQSNIDISTEFTDLIVTQRGFQAGTKVITTVDEMLQDLINLRR